MRTLLRAARGWSAVWARVAALTLAIGCEAVTSSDNRGRTTSVSPLWSHADPAGARARPFADGDLAVFTTNSSNRVVAMDATSGVVRWQQSVAPGPASGLPSGNAVGIGQTIVVPAWDLYAFDRTTGAVRWTFAPDAEYPAGAGIATDGTMIVSPGSLTHLYGIEASTGVARWAIDLGERAFEPVVDAGIAYLTTRGRIGTSDALGAGHALAVRVADGAVLWSAPLPDIVNSPFRGGSNKGRGSNRVDVCRFIDERTCVWIQSSDWCGTLGVHGTRAFRIWYRNRWRRRRECKSGGGHRRSGRRKDPGGPWQANELLSVLWDEFERFRQGWR